MGCITVHIDKTGDNASVSANKKDGAAASAYKVNAAARCVLTFFHNVLVGVFSYRGAKVSVSRTNGISVSAGIVCTVNRDASGNEMWWCDQWRVLWNNGVKALWRN